MRPPPVPPLGVCVLHQIQADLLELYLWNHAKYGGDTQGIIDWETLLSGTIKRLLNIRPLHNLSKGCRVALIMSIVGSARVDLYCPAVVAVLRCDWGECSIAQDLCKDILRQASLHFMLHPFPFQAPGNTLLPVQPVNAWTRADIAAAIEKGAMDIMRPWEQQQQGEGQDITGGDEGEELEEKRKALFPRPQRRQVAKCDSGAENGLSQGSSRRGPEGDADGGGGDRKSKNKRRDWGRGGRVGGRWSNSVKRGNGGSFVGDVKEELVALARLCRGAPRRSTAWELVAGYVERHRLHELDHRFLAWGRSRLREMGTTVFDRAFSSSSDVSSGKRQVRSRQRCQVPRKKVGDGRDGREGSVFGSRESRPGKDHSRGQGVSNEQEKGDEVGQGQGQGEALELTLGQQGPTVFSGNATKKRKRHVDATTTPEKAMGSEVSIQRRSRKGEIMGDIDLAWVKARGSSSPEVTKQIDHKTRGANGEPVLESSGKHHKLQRKGKGRGKISFGDKCGARFTRGAALAYNARRVEGETDAGDRMGGGLMLGASHNIVGSTASLATEEKINGTGAPPGGDTSVSSDVSDGGSDHGYRTAADEIEGDVFVDNGNNAVGIRLWGGQGGHVKDQEDAEMLKEAQIVRQDNAPMEDARKTVKRTKHHLSGPSFRPAAACSSGVLDAGGGLGEGREVTGKNEGPFTTPPETNGSGHDHRCALGCSPGVEQYLQVPEDLVEKQEDCRTTIAALKAGTAAPLDADEGVEYGRGFVTRINAPPADSVTPGDEQENENSLTSPQNTPQNTPMGSPMMQRVGGWFLRRLTWSS
ncbi:unnamed protein product [Choristocarpus tenellus]